MFIFVPELLTESFGRFFWTEFSDGVFGRTFCFSFQAIIIFYIIWGSPTCVKRGNGPTEPQPLDNTSFRTNVLGLLALNIISAGWETTAKGGDSTVGKVNFIFFTSIGNISSISSDLVFCHCKSGKGIKNTILKVRTFLTAPFPNAGKHASNLVKDTATCLRR